MKTHVKLVTNVFKSLFFKKFKLLYVTLAFLAMVPILDIILYKQIVDEVISNFETKQFALISLTAYLLLLIIVSAFKFYFNVKRIKYVNLMTIYRKRVLKFKPVSENWYRASLLEMFLIAISLLQVILISLLSIVLSPLFGSIFLVIMLIVVTLIFKNFTIELANQVGFIQAQYRSKRSQSSSKIVSRIFMSESSTFLASVIMNLVLLIDFVFLYYGYLDENQFIAFVFVSKYIAGSYSMLSSSLMRLARSLSYTRKIFMNE